MGIDFKRGAVHGLDPAETALQKEVAEMRRKGGSRGWTTQYLLFRHDRATELSGREPHGAEIEEIDERIARDMGRIERDRELHLAEADRCEDLLRSYGISPDASFVPEDVAKQTGTLFTPAQEREITEKRYRYNTVGTDGPSPEGTEIKLMPLYEAIYTYNGRHPGIIKPERMDALPGYRTYAAELDGRSVRTGREVSSRLSGLADGAEADIERQAE